MTSRPLSSGTSTLHELLPHVHCISSTNRICSDIRNSLDHDAQDEDSLAKVAKAKHAIQVKGRDAGRVPMPVSLAMPYSPQSLLTGHQWDNTMHGGFTSPEITPWIPAMKDGTSWTAEAECKDPHSVYNLYKQAIAIRKNNKTLASPPTTCTYSLRSSR